MKIGLVGFPGAGKTTVFNALTGLTAETGYTATRGRTNLGAVKVPDTRVDALSRLYAPKKTTYAEITFADLARDPLGGQVRGLDGKTKNALHEALKRAVAEDMSEEEFADSIFIGDCPSCGSSKITNCEDEAGIEDPTVGRCLDCRALWCSECGELFSKNQKACGHWQVCDRCEDGDDCAVLIEECELILAWKAKQP